MDRVTAYRRSICPHNVLVPATGIPCIIEVPFTLEPFTLSIRPFCITEYISAGVGYVKVKVYVAASPLDVYTYVASRSPQLCYRNAFKAQCEQEDGEHANKHFAMAVQPSEPQIGLGSGSGSG